MEFYGVESEETSRRSRVLRVEAAYFIRAAMYPPFNRHFS
jgi:hypothetical protein